METYKQTLYDRFDREIKLEVETAASAIDQIHKRQLSGELTEAQAKATAAEIVRQLRFDNNNSYFWVDTTEGVNVVLPNNKAEEQIVLIPKILMEYIMFRNLLRTGSFLAAAILIMLSRVREKPLQLRKEGTHYFTSHIIG